MRSAAPKVDRAVRETPLPDFGFKMAEAAMQVSPVMVQPQKKSVRSVSLEPVNFRSAEAAMAAPPPKQKS